MHIFYLYDRQDRNRDFDNIGWCREAACGSIVDSLHAARYVSVKGIATGPERADWQPRRVRDRPCSKHIPEVWLSLLDDIKWTFGLKEDELVFEIYDGDEWYGNIYRIPARLATIPMLSFLFKMIRMIVWWPATFKPESRMRARCSLSFRIGRHLRHLGNRTWQFEYSGSWWVFLHLILTNPVVAIEESEECNGYLTYLKRLSRHGKLGSREEKLYRLVKNNAPFGVLQYRQMP